jgi:hypothetical protein
MPEQCSTCQAEEVTMNKRIYYVNDGSAFQKVLMIGSLDAPEVSVYCPPAIEHGPWLEPFASLDSALELSSSLIKQMGQAAVIITYDNAEWWLQGLTIIRDADTYFEGAD